MPRTTIAVTSKSQRKPTSATSLESPAASLLINPMLLSRARVFEPASSGAATQNNTLAAVWTQPVSQPRWGFRVREIHV